MAKYINPCAVMSSGDFRVWSCVCVVHVCALLHAHRERSRGKHERGWNFVEPGNIFY